MKSRFLIPVLLFVSSSLLAADALTGVRSVFIDGDLRARHDITRALKRALPDVRVVSRESDADAVLGFRFAGMLGPASFSVPAQPQTVIVSVGNRIEEQAAPSQYQVPASSWQPTVSSWRSEGVARLRDGTELVLFEGIDTPMSPGQFANRFIAAWRASNP